jgi:hypothetical protein
MSIQSILSQAFVAPDRQSHVVHLILQSDFVSPTPNGTILHVWSKHAEELVDNAKDETRVFEWAVDAGTPAPLLFVSHVMDHVNELGLHTRVYGVVREQTALNVYNRDDLVACIKHAAEVGVDRDNIMAEYENAYLDFHELVKAKTLFATNDRAWHV